jgi:preprotein translocase subunit SecA
VRAAQASDPYQEFLSKNRGLGDAADAVVEGVVRLARLKSPEDFRHEVLSFKEEAAKSQAKDSGQLFGLPLPSRKIDQTTIRGLSLVCRAAEVAMGFNVWNHQIVCALLLQSGKIVEMPNGSGKTLVAGIAAGFNCLPGKKTHIVTCNDYLAERDVRGIGRMYQLLGLKVGVLFSDQSVHFAWGVLDADGVTLRVAPKQRPAVTPVIESQAPEETAQPEQPSAGGGAPMPPTVLDAALSPKEELLHETNLGYTIDQNLEPKGIFGCDVVYGRIESFGSAYLKDNLVSEKSEQVMTQRDFLIVDECDSVLLDDLRTPLLITTALRHGPAGALPLYELHRLAGMLAPGLHFVSSGKSLQLTYAGLDRIKELTGQDLFTESAGGLAHGLVNALLAIHAYRRDEDYLVQGNQIVIIEKEGGRLLFGRRYLEGLHEALEVKEGLGVGGTQQSKPAARITIKHFVKTYETVSGMSGAIGQPEEYREFYGLDCVMLQPYPLTRSDETDVVFHSKQEALEHGLKVAAWASGRGQPVLINVPKLKDVAEVARHLEQSSVSFQSLDASTVRNLGEEAEKVRLAGSPRLITVCSKIAARGTDIELGEEACRAGGLFVIGIERAKVRRYDDQLCGRAGRHGAPGSSVFVLSLEDELLSYFVSRWTDNVLRKLGMEEGVPIESKFITRRISAAQRKLLQQSYNYRAQVVEFDDIVARHRLVFYDLRQKLLEKDDLRGELRTVLENWIYHKGRTFLRTRSELQLERDNVGRFLGSLEFYFSSLEIERIAQVRSRKRQMRTLKETLEQKLEPVLGDGGGPYLPIIKYRMLNTLDEHWSNYLKFEDTSREEIKLYSSEDTLAIARYAESMEERFDSFFYDVGEDILTHFLRLQSYSESAPQPPR